MGTGSMGRPAEAAEVHPPGIAPQAPHGMGMLSEAWASIGQPTNGDGILSEAWASIGQPTKGDGILSEAWASIGQSARGMACCPRSMAI